MQLDQLFPGNSIKMSLTVVKSDANGFDSNLNEFQYFGDDINMSVLWSALDKNLVVLVDRKFNNYSVRNILEFHHIKKL